MEEDLDSEMRDFIISLLILVGVTLVAAQGQGCYPVVERVVLCNCSVP
jgi:hypothetical protein